jgi:predicted lactoylglutathione lyase
MRVTSVRFSGPNVRCSILTGPRQMALALSRRTAIAGYAGSQGANSPTMVFDHIDLRVADVAAARSFYDPFLKAFGFRGRRQANGDIVYYRFSDRRVQEAVALIQAGDHIANAVRLAFHATDPEDVDRVAAIALEAGARSFEAPQWCPEIADRYYAAFFEDPSGNRLEVVHR